MIVTRGFRDTLRIARSARTNDLDLHTQTPPPDVVAREDVVEVDERVDFAGRVPSTLLGYPVYESSAMMAAPLSTATASNDDIVVLGDFSKYYIVDRIGAQIASMMARCCGSETAGRPGRMASRNWCRTFCARSRSSTWPAVRWPPISRIRRCNCSLSCE